MLKEIVEGIENQSIEEGVWKYRWVGGSDSYKDIKKIRELVAYYDFYVEYIEDYGQLLDRKKRNAKTMKDLKKLGVTAIGNTEMTVGDFKKADEKDIKHVK